MTTRPPIERFYFIAGQLRRRVPVRIERVAHQFEVSPKTIRRDLDFLRDRLRYDIFYKRSARGWVFRTTPPKPLI